MGNTAGRRSARRTVGRTLRGGAFAALFVVAIAGCRAGHSGPAAAGLAVAATGSAATPTPTPAGPVITHKTVVKTAEIPFGTSTVDDPDRPVGETAVVTAGTNGVTTATWDVRYADGVEAGRAKVSEVTTTEAVTEVTAVGSKQPKAPEPEPAAAPEPEPAAPEAAAAGSGCDPNYEGACVPIDSDVDCAGGSGNGPSYVEGPVRVVGSDIYKLDADHDGVGCE